MKSTLERIQNEEQYFCAHANFIFMGTRKYNERARPWLSDRWKTTKKIPIAMSYLRAQRLFHFFSPDIFKGLIFSKWLLGTHTTQWFGGSPVPTSWWQIGCATARGTFTCLYVEAYPAAMLVISLGMSVKLIRSSQHQTLCTACCKDAD